MVPRTVKAVDTAQLIRLDAEAVAHGLNRHHEAGWLAEYADPGATHYLYPALVHRLEGRPEHWRCMVLLAVRGGEHVFSLIDVLPDSFTALPETLDPARKTAIARRLIEGPLLTQAEWARKNRHIGEGGS